MHIDDARIIVNSMDGNVWYLDEGNKRVIRKATDGIAVRYRKRERHSLLFISQNNIVDLSVNYSFSFISFLGLCDFKK